MKTLKNYAMALVALVIAATSVTLMSFDKKQQTQDDPIWFLMDQDGETLTNITTDDPSTLCDDLSGENCARAFYESQTEPDLVNGGIKVKSTETNNFHDSRGKN